MLHFEGTPEGGFGSVPDVRNQLAHGKFLATQQISRKIKPPPIKVGDRTLPDDLQKAA